MPAPNPSAAIATGTTKGVCTTHSSGARDRSPRAHAIPAAPHPHAPPAMPRRIPIGYTHPGRAYLAARRHHSGATSRLMPPMPPGRANPPPIPIRDPIATANPPMRAPPKPPPMWAPPNRRPCDRHRNRHPYGRRPHMATATTVAATTVATAAAVGKNSTPRARQRHGHRQDNSEGLAFHDPLRSQAAITRAGLTYLCGQRHRKEDRRHTHTTFFGQDRHHGDGHPDYSTLSRKSAFLDIHYRNPIYSRPDPT